MFIKWTSPVPVLGISDVLFHFYSIFDRNSAASDLGLHCLPRTQKRDARLPYFAMYYTHFLKSRFRFKVLVSVM